MDLDALIQEMKDEQEGVLPSVRSKDNVDTAASKGNAKSKKKVAETRRKKARAQRTCSPSQFPTVRNRLSGSADEVVLNFGADLPAERDRRQLAEEYIRVMRDWGHGGVVAGVYACVPAQRSRQIRGRAGDSVLLNPHTPLTEETERILLRDSAAHAWRPSDRKALRAIV
jgi:hypothetical protein